MILPTNRIGHLAGVTHEGKLVLVVTDVAGKLWYTVKQEGFERSPGEAPAGQLTGWESWRELELPGDAEDPSVLAREAAELTRADDPDTYLLRSRYASRALSAVAPVHLVSALGHLYVFRQSKASTLLVDRFVLDGMTNSLVRKLEVRFQRSEQRYAGETGGSFHDTLDYRDLDGNYFYEPTTELCLIDGLQDGWLSAVLVPTSEHEIHRWHIFAYNRHIERVELITIRMSEEGLFDLRDYTVFEGGSPSQPTLAARIIPGVIRRSFDLGGATVTNGMSATRYDLQRESAGEDRTLLRTDTRLLLAVPTDRGTAALSFAIAADGTLGQIDEEPAYRLLRAEEREILLPVGTLDDIAPIGDETPPPSGTIKGMTVATVADGAEDRVVIFSPEAATLANRDQVEIRGTRSYDGVYAVANVTADSFEITAQWVEDDLGFWEKREDEALGLRFDGMIIAYEQAGEGKLKVTAPRHGLTNGEEVRLTGSGSIDGSYPAVKLDDGQFVIDRRWTRAEAASLTLQAMKLRGIALDGHDDHVELPPACIPGGDEITIGFWAKGGASLPDDACVLSAVDANGQRTLRIAVPDQDGRVIFECGSHGHSLERIDKPAQPAEYRNRWVHWAFVKSATGRQMKIYRNGVLWHEEEDKGQGKDRPIDAAARVYLGASAEDPAGGHYQGEIADLRIWERALGQDELQRGLQATLTGKEIGLRGYWRLNAVVEGDERRIIDFSRHGGDGLVRGGACVGVVSLPRTLIDGTPAVRYCNAELLAVSEQATYIEEFELRVLAEVELDLTDLENADGRGGKIFRMSCWGVSGRDEQPRIPVAMSQNPFEEVGDGWFRASGRFTVPGGVAMVRSFEIADVRGDWRAIEVRRHRIRMVSNAVSEVTHVDALELSTLADHHAALKEALAELRRKEQEEALLLAEKAELEESFDALARIEETRLRVDALRLRVRELGQRAQMLANEHARQQNNPLNYYCHIGNAAAGSEQRAQAVQRNQDVVVQLQQRTDLASQKWRFVATGDGVYHLYNAGVGDAHRVQAMEGQQSFLALQPGADHAWQQWKLIAAGDGSHFMYNAGAGDSKRVQATKRGTAWELELQSVGTDPRHQWSLVSTGEPSNDVVARAFEEWHAVQLTLEQTRAELAVLEAAIQASEPERVAWRTRLHQVVARLGLLRSEMSALSLEFLAGLRSDLQAPQAMPEIATDRRGLSTRGAFLGFVDAASRLSALETCEGNVQLSYFDELGRIRITNYDATADGRNATFEQWLPEAQRAAPRIGARHGAIRLASPIDLPSEWSIEAWFFHPLPRREWNVLAGNEDGSDCPIVIYDGRYLGIRSQGFFFGNGASLDELTGGWHHLTAVKRGSGQDAVIAFHVDGKRFGGEIRPRVTSLVLDGLNDYVALPPASVPPGSEISIGFWLRCHGSQEGTVIEAMDSMNMRVLAIDIPGPGGVVAFECGNDGQSSDRIAKPAQIGEHPAEWAHWTFTKNVATGTMKIYRNGRLRHRETGKAKLLPAAASVALGRLAREDRNYFQGRIANLCIWNRELREAEIHAHLTGTMTGAASGAVGCWRFEGGAQGGAAGAYGTIHGAPAYEAVFAGGQSRIACLANTLTVQRARISSMPLGNRAMHFDGDDAHVELPAMELDTTQGLTVEAWVRYESFTDESRILDLGNGPAADNIYLGNHGTSNTLSFHVFHGAQKVAGLDAPGVLYRDRWMHLACTIDVEGQGKIYRNGQMVHSGPMELPNQVMRTKNHIGKSNWPGHGYFAGQVAELRVWRAARTQVEIQEAMYNRLTGSEEGLASYWPLDDVRVDQEIGNVLDLAGDHAGTARGSGVLNADALPIEALGVDALEDQSFGQLAEVRVWRIPLEREEIEVNSKILLTGNEPGLMAYYPLDEGRGTEVRDRCGYNPPGALVRRVGPTVLQLDGHDDHVTLADDPALRLTTYTVELWMKPDGVPDQEWTGIIGKPGRNFHIWLHWAGFIHHRFHTTANTNAGAPDTPPGSIAWYRWNHVAITNDGLTARTYINGELVAQGATGAALIVDNTPLIIGRNLDGAAGHYFKGRLADVRIWDRARAQGEIQAGMRTYPSGQEAGLVACWPMNGIETGGATRTLVDLTGKHQVQVQESSTIIDSTLPVRGQDRYMTDESMWWPCTAVIGNLGNRVVRFDGTGGHVALPPLTVGGADGLTVEAWVRYQSFQHGSRVIELGNGPGADNIFLANQGKSNTLSFQIFRGDQASGLEAPDALELGQWMHLAATIDAGGKAVLYKNGRVLQQGTLHLPAGIERIANYVGRSNWDSDGYLDGQLAAVRVWRKARSQAEIRMTMHERLTGVEEGLLACWGLNWIVPAVPRNLVMDHAPGARHGVISGAVVVDDYTLPLGHDALVSAEYQRVDIDPATQKPYFLMRRLFASPTPAGVLLLQDKRVEEIEMKWVGNAQFEPTLLGYIEGAPPVPSENLTESSDYNGATAVELSTSDDVELRWNRSEEFGMGGSFHLFLGVETETSAGIAVMTKITDVRVGLEANLDFSKQSMHETSISTQSSLRMTDRLELRGTPEATPKFSHLGRRFIPKNVGYALVVSGLGDVYVTRLARTRKMLSYQIRPVEGVPPEVNTVTFLMNPGYVMQGSLDGMTGSQATSSRYNSNVPELRAQYGASYPGSFYRPEEARALKQEIEYQDKQREAYYEQFLIRPGFEELSLPESGGGSGMEIEMGDPPPSWPEPMQEAWRQGAEEPLDEWSTEWKEMWNKERQKRLKDQASEQQEQQESGAEAAKAKIETLIEKVKNINGALGYETWQKKMEELRIDAGKRNIVNSYVWDADGGLRTEAQSFASTAEHTIGGSFQMDASLGLEGSIGLGPVKVELTALATVNMTQSVSKTETRSRGIELNVDLSGVESIGITDHDDRPLLPGEKVDRYRFMSFYLEGSTDNYNEFFRRVVDPDWLRSHDEEAQLLREAMGKANKSWRVLHRVTYVERPAALGLDRDTRRVQEEMVAQSLMEYILRIYSRQSVIEAKLNDVLNQLATAEKK
jgi:hypothetical protein